MLTPVVEKFEAESWKGAGITSAVSCVTTVAPFFGQMTFIRQAGDSPGNSGEPNHPGASVMFVLEPNDNYAADETEKTIGWEPVRYFSPDGFSGIK